jgi:prophage regulatory protein
MRPTKPRPDEVCNPSFDCRGGAVSDVGGPTLEHVPDRIVREPERRQITGVPTSTWYELQRRGLAPKPVKLSSRSVGWSLNALGEWVRARLDANLTDRVLDDARQTPDDAAARVVEKL